MRYFLSLWDIRKPVFEITHVRNDCYVMMCVYLVSQKLLICSHYCLRTSLLRKDLIKNSTHSMWDVRKRDVAL